MFNCRSLSLESSASMNLELPDEYDSSRPPVELLIPRSHNHLGVVRLFLPYEYRDHNSGTTRIVRWSELELARSGTKTIDADAEFFNYTFPALDEYRGTFLHKDDDPGLVDPRTLAVLNEVSRPFGRLHGFHWAELDATPKVEERIVIHGSNYDRFEFMGGSIDPKFRLPQFVVDENGEFAWGANLYPDSILIAAPGDICDLLLSDPRIDCTLVAHSLPGNLEPPFRPVSSIVRKPRQRTITTLEMNVEDLLALLQKCIFPGGETQPHHGTRQKGIRLQALGGAVLASSALMNDHVQAIATPQYIDPELDIFVQYRELKGLMQNLRSNSYERVARLIQRNPTELGLAPRSHGPVTFALSAAESSSHLRPDATFTVFLSENENPDMSSSFLAVDSVSASIPFEVAAYYVSWIVDTAAYPFGDSSDVIQIGASTKPHNRTIITVAKDWRISCVINNDERDN